MIYPLSQSGNCPRFLPLTADLTLGCSLYDPQCYSFDINIPFLIKEYTAKVMPLR